MDDEIFKQILNGIEYDKMRTRLNDIVNGKMPDTQDVRGKDKQRASSVDDAVLRLETDSRDTTKTREPKVQRTHAEKKTKIAATAIDTDAHEYVADEQNNSFVGTAADVPSHSFSMPAKLRGGMMSDPFRAIISKQVNIPKVPKYDTIIQDPTTVHTKNICKPRHSWGGLEKCRGMIGYIGDDRKIAKYVKRFARQMPLYENKHGRQDQSTHILKNPLWEKKICQRPS